MFSGLKDSEVDSFVEVSFDGKCDPRKLFRVGLSRSDQLQHRLVNVIKIFTPILIEIHLIWIINEVLSYCFLAYLGCKLCNDIAKGDDCQQKRKSDAHPSYVTEQFFTKYAHLHTSIKCESLQKLEGLLKMFSPCNSSGITKNQDLSCFEQQFKTSSKIHYHGMTHGNEKQSDQQKDASKENEPPSRRASQQARGASPNVSGAGAPNGNGGSSGDGGDDEDKRNPKKIPQDAPDLIPDVNKETADEKSSTTEIANMLANFSFKTHTDEKPPSKPCPDSPMDISPAIAVPSVAAKRRDSINFDFAFSEEQQFFSPEYCFNVLAAQEEEGQNGTRVVQSDTYMSVGSNDDADDDDASYLSDTTSESQVSICVEGTQYHLREVLGRGAFGECRIAVDVNSGKLYAVKVIARDRFDKSEISVMTRLTVSPYIIHYHGHVYYDEKVCLLMAYAQGGTLQGFLRQMQSQMQRLDLKTVTDFFHGIISGIAFMHSQKIIHADLKSENILMMSSDNAGHYRPVICDFGLAIDLMSAESVTAAAHGRGTIRYRSPELCRGRTMNTFASDIWSTGCILVEMDTGDPPWRKAAQRGDPALVFTIGSAREPPIPEDGFPCLRPFYLATLAIEPEERSTALEIVNALEQFHLRLDVKGPED